jgi:hypothetical protein
MSAAQPLNFDELELDADQLRSLQEHLAARRNAAEVPAAPPPLLGPSAAPLLHRAVTPVIVQGAAASAVPHIAMDGLPSAATADSVDAAASAGPRIAMAGRIEKLLNEQSDLRFLVDQKCAVDAMQSLLRQQPFGKVEAYFSSHRKTAELDTFSPLHYTVLCPELEKDDADPLCALRALILSGEQKTLPGLRCIFHNFLHLSFFLSHPSYATCSPAFSHASMLGARTLHVKIGAFDTFT